MPISDIVDFATATSAVERYATAPERVISGQPQQAVWNHYSSTCGRFSSGIWEGSPGHWRVRYSEHEYCEILHGLSVLHDDNGGSRTLRVGDRFVIPSGFTGSWEVVEHCRKVYVIFEPSA